MTSQDKIQEMKFLEQNLQNLLFQKQAFQLELAETKSALKEIGISKDEVFKVIGQVMIKIEKAKIQNELLDKQNILELRIKTIEKQEDSLAERLENLRDEIIKEMK